MSLGNWEGKADDEAEPEELPESELSNSASDGKGRIYNSKLGIIQKALFCILAEKRFLFLCLKFYKQNYAYVKF